MTGRDTVVGGTRLRAIAGCLIGGCIIGSIVALPAGSAHSQGSVPALPTFPPIAANLMRGGAGPAFIEQNYQLISPSIRKCANDWPSTIYVEYRPGLPGKVSIPESAMAVLPFLQTLSEQTGRRFAVQRGIERQAPVSASNQDWLPVLERFADATSLDLENVQDILVLSELNTASEGARSKLVDLVIAIGIVAVVLGGVGWYIVRPRKRVDPRGGWS